MMMTITMITTIATTTTMITWTTTTTTSTSLKKEMSKKCYMETYPKSSECFVWSESPQQFHEGGRVDAVGRDVKVLQNVVVGQGVC
jgi:hypothetical protein